MGHGIWEGTEMHKKLQSGGGGGARELLTPSLPHVLLDGTSPIREVVPQASSSSMWGRSRLPASSLFAQTPPNLSPTPQAPGDLSGTQKPQAGSGALGGGQSPSSPSLRP